MEPDLSLSDKIKLAIVALGVLAGALLCFNGPAELREDVPYHRELGLGFGAFGVLIFLALFSVRAKAFLIFIVVTAITIGEAAVTMTFPFPSWQFIGLGIVTVLTACYAVFCLIDAVQGRDPSGVDG